MIAVIWRAIIKPALTTMPCCQPAQALGQQTTADGVQNTWVKRPLGLTKHRDSRSGLGQQLRPRLPCFGPVTGSVHRSRLSAAASVTTGLSSSSSSAHQYIQHPVTPYYGPPASTVTVTWPGLLAALGLAATALVAAATTCFFLYLKPVMQAMSVTLAEMEAAAKEMQQAAQEVEELVGGVNSAIKALMQPTALLKWTSSMPPSTTSSTTSSAHSSIDEPTAGAGSSASDSTSSAPVPAAVAGGASTSSSAARQLTDQLEGFAPTLLEGLKGLQRLQLSDLGAAALKLSGLEEAPGKQQQQQQQRTRLRRAVQGSASSSSTISSSSTMVWDMLASSVSTRATRRSLARLRSDLSAAANVLSVLLAPPNRRLYEQMQQGEQQLQAQQVEPQQAQQQQQVEAQQRPAPLISSQPGNTLPSLSSSNSSSSAGGSRTSGSQASSSTSAQQASRGRRIVQVDEWGLPITAAELASSAAADASVSDRDTVPNQQPSIRQPLADVAAAATSGSLQQQGQQQQGQQQQQQQRGRRRLSYSSDDEDSWHLDLSHYGRYLEQEHTNVTDSKDSGITWQQLEQDASLMQRVFCDNQELAFAEQWDLRRQQQQSPQPGGHDAKQGNRKDAEGQ